jgi:hypothetical protein
MPTAGEKIVLGSGTLYCTEFAGTMPDNVTIETDTNRLGHILGGATLEYKPTFYEAKDDLGMVSKVIITEEEAILKSGIMTWCGDTLKKLCSTARVTEAAGVRTVKIGGTINDDGKKYVLHFLHEDAVDGDIRVTIVGQNRAGFTLAFAKDKETVIDAEFKALPQDTEGTLILYKEEINELGELTIGVVAGGTTGKTKVNTVTPAAESGNSLKGKIGASAESIIYDTVYSDGWTAVTPGTTEFVATDGNVLTIIEVDASNKAKKVGYVTIHDQIG